MIKKIVSLALAAVMTFSLTACGGGSVDLSGEGGSAGDGGLIADEDEITNDGFEADLSKVIPKDTVTLKVTSQLANTSSDQTGWFAKVMLDKFNVKVTYVSGAGDSMKTLIESGDIGDIIFFGSIDDDYKTCANNGMLLDWEENGLMETYAPYIYANKDTTFAKPFQKSSSETDGIHYSLGNEISSASEGGHQQFIYYPCLRWDLYKQLGYPTISTLEDYKTILADMQKLEPTSDIGTKTYGVTLHTAWEGTAFMVMYVKSTAAFYGWDEFNCGLYNSVTDEFQGCLQEDGIYFRCLKFYNDLNQAGLVDPDSETNGWDECAEAMTNGETFMDIFSYVGTAYNTAAHLSAGKAMVPIAADDFRTLAYGFNVYGGSYQTCIGAATQYPELCMAIVNWMYTPEGMLSMKYGKKSEKATPDAEDGIWYVDEDGYYCMTDLGLNCMRDQKTSMPEALGGGTWDKGQCGWNSYGWATQATIDGSAHNEKYDYQSWESVGGLADYEIIQDYYNYYNVDSFDAYCDMMADKNGGASVVPSTDYVPTKMKKDLKSTWAIVYDIVKTDSWKAIKATNDSDYDKYVAEMIKDAYAAGYEDCLAYSQGEADLRHAAEDAQE